MPFLEDFSCCLVCFASLPPPKDHMLLEGMVWGVLFLLSWAHMEKLTTNER